jgi:uncharacterized protein YciI
MRLLAASLCFISLLAGQPMPLPPPNYCFAFLNAVPDRPQLPEKEAMEIQKQHLAHLEKLWEQGWLEAAGPIVTPGGPRGILISKCKSVEEANELASADPAVRNRRLYVESYRWSGPDGIGEAYRKQKAANPGSQDRMVKHGLVLLRKSEAWTGWPSKEVFEGHLEHIGQLRKAGKLLAAGPFHDGGAWIGVIVLRETSVADARSMSEKDPLVTNGFARVEAHEWSVVDSVFPPAP